MDCPRVHERSVSADLKRAGSGDEIGKMAARSVKSAAKSKSTKMLKKVLVLLEKNNNQIEELRKEVKNSLSDIMDEVKKQSRPHPTASLQKRSKKVRVPAVCKVSMITLNV